MLGKSEVEREVETVPSKPVQCSPWTAGSSRGLVEDLGAFHCEHPTKDCNPREGDYVESAKPRSRVGVMTPPEQTMIDRIRDGIPQFLRTIQLGDQAIGRVCQRFMTLGILPVVFLWY